MKKICLVYGGDSLENEISVLTALRISKDLDKYSYPYMMVYGDKIGQFYTGEALKKRDNYQMKKGFICGSFIKKNGKNYFRSRFKKEEFDLVILLAHGKGAEDGTLGGYFDTLKIPCIYPGLTKSSLIQDKGLFKEIMKSLNISQCKFQRINERQFNNFLQKNKNITELGYPLIIKPNHLGSSIGIVKAHDEEELKKALEEVFTYEDEAIIEECLESFKEINVAIVKKDDEIVVSELERVNNSNDILTFMDKYDNYKLTESHIIPADIDHKIRKKIINLARKIYLSLNLTFVVRFDFLLDSRNNAVYLNEINAIPGSLAYYLFEPIGIKTIDLIQILLDNYENEQIKKSKKKEEYEDDILSYLKEK